MDWFNLVLAIALLFYVIWMGITLNKWRTKYTLAIFTILLIFLSIALTDLFSPGKFNSILATVTHIFSDSPTVVKAVQITFHSTLLLVLFAILFYPNVKQFLADPKSIKNPEKRDKLYRVIIKIFPRNSEFLYNYAHFLWDIRKEYDKAEEYCQKAIEIHPAKGMVSCYYAILLEKMEEYDKAEMYYWQAIAKEPKNAIILTSYARFLMYTQKEYSKAENYFQKAMELDSNYAYLLAMYAHLMEINEDYEQAESLYKKSLKLDSKYALALARYARFSMAIKEDYDKAEKYFEKAIKLDPMNASIIHNFAFFLWTIRKDYEQADNFFQKALQLEPDDQELLDSYSHFLAEKSV